MSGIVKLSGVLLVLLLASLGLLLALGGISFDEFQALTVKGVIIIAILGVAGVAISLLTRGNKTEKS